LGISFGKGGFNNWLQKTGVKLGACLFREFLQHFDLIIKENFLVGLLPGIALIFRATRFFSQGCMTRVINLKSYGITGYPISQQLCRISPR
jgi:hypothetical protein